MKRDDLATTEVIEVEGAPSEKVVEMEETPKVVEVTPPNGEVATLDPEVSPQIQEESPVEVQSSAEIEPSVEVEPSNKEAEVENKVDSAKEARREKRRQRRRKQAVQQVETRISACGRCCFFFADYKHLVDENEIGVACLKSEQSGWIHMRWSLPMRQLVRKSFGCRLDIDFRYYESRCPNCGRRVKFSVNKDGKSTFAIER